MKKITIASFLGIIAMLASILGCTRTINSITEPSTINQAPESELIGKVLGLTEDEIYLVDAPSADAKRIVNKKTTAALGETQYISVDTSCKVKVVEIKDDWVRLEVVDPEWLKDSHKGWAKNIVLEGFTPQITVDRDSYRVVRRSNKGDFENIYVVYTKKDITPAIARALIAEIRKDRRSSNIYVFENEEIIPMFDTYPLSKESYINVADSFICMSSFDAPLAVSFYPYQDFQYKEYGGTNWKKDPIK